MQMAHGGRGRFGSPPQRGPGDGTSADPLIRWLGGKTVARHSVPCPRWAIKGRAPRCNVAATPNIAHQLGVLVPLQPRGLTEMLPKWAQDAHFSRWDGLAEPSLAALVLAQPGLWQAFTPVP